MRRLSGFLLLAGVLVLAGCGSDEGPSSTGDSDGGGSVADAGAGAQTGCVDGDCSPDLEWANWHVPVFIDSNYTTTADTVTDRTTGLVWQRNVPSSLYSWTDAKSYCAGLTLGGVSGWRLPTRIELLSIVDLTRLNPAINPNAFPGTPPEYFWASSPHADSTNGAWRVTFGKGSAHGGLVSGSSLRVRCVR